MYHVLVVQKQNVEDYKKHFINKLQLKLERKNYQVSNCSSMHEAFTISNLNSRVVAVIYDWEDFLIKDLYKFSEHKKNLPIFAITHQYATLEIDLEDFDLNLRFLQYGSNLLRDDVEQILRTIKDYLNNLFPPFTSTLMNYVKKLNYTFCTPGHLGGTAFQKSPIGALFYDFYGENIFQSDLSISIEELGSLLDHSGPIQEAEQFIASIFGSDRSLIVTNGTSTANKIVGMSSATSGDTVLIDRNCHKSIAYFLMMVDVIPLYMKPMRNAYGILGGIHADELTETTIKEKINRQPLANSWPKYAVITHSTYDGIFYNLNYIQKKLKVDTLHFDSAWVPYTKFHPIYSKFSAMNLVAPKHQIIFETQSTHKLLAAFSQSSMIHVKGAYNKDLLHENYMMHTSSSPFYPIIASCEIAAAMMQGEQGNYLMQETINLAFDFRHEIKELKKQSKTWYYDVWQPSDDNSRECFEIKPKQHWHGFKNVADDYLFLDPIKVTVLLPGISNSKLDAWGIPAVVVEKFLSTHGIIVEKTGSYSLLFLFSIGISQAKSMALLATLNQFKQWYDEDALIKNVLPQVYNAHPDFYHHMTIQTLAQNLHQLFVQQKLPEVLSNAFDILPLMRMTPHCAYQQLVRGDVTKVPIQNLVGRTSAVMILPYPPGIPLVMPGEAITEESVVILEFLLLLDAMGNHYPGFETMIHGTEVDENGQRYVLVLST